MNNEKIQHFAKLLESDRIDRLITSDMACDANIINCKVKVIPGKKYTKVDVGTSGSFMIDEEDNIFGIKAYGVIHKGHRYGTLDTVDNYYWGYYGGYAKRTDNHPTQLLSVDEVLKERESQQEQPSNVIMYDFVNHRKIG